MDSFGSKFIRSQSSAFDCSADFMVSLKGETEKKAIRDALEVTLTESSTIFASAGLSDTQQARKYQLVTGATAQHLGSTVNSLSLTKFSIPSPIPGSGKPIAKIYRSAEDGKPAVLIFCDDFTGSDHHPLVYYFEKFDKSISDELTSIEDASSIRKVIGDHLADKSWEVEAIVGSLNGIESSCCAQCRNAWISNLVNVLSEEFKGGSPQEGLLELGRRLLSQVNTYAKQGSLTDIITDAFEKSLGIIQKKLELGTGPNHDIPIGESLQGGSTAISGTMPIEIPDIGQPREDLIQFYAPQGGEASTQSEITALASISTETLLQGKFSSMEAKEIAEKQFCDMLFLTLCHSLEKGENSPISGEDVDFCKSVLSVRSALDAVAHHMTNEKYSLYCLFLQRLIIAPAYQEEDVGWLRVLSSDSDGLGDRLWCNLSKEFIQLGQEIYEVYKEQQKAKLQGPQLDITRQKLEHLLNEVRSRSPAICLSKEVSNLTSENHGEIVHTHDEQIKKKEKTKGELQEKLEGIPSKQQEILAAQTEIKQKEEEILKYSNKVFREISVYICLCGLQAYATRMTAYDPSNNLSKKPEDLDEEREKVKVEFFAKLEERREACLNSIKTFMPKEDVNGEDDAEKAAIAKELMSLFILVAPAKDRASYENFPIVKDGKGQAIYPESSFTKEAFNGIFSVIFSKLATQKTNLETEQNALFVSKRDIRSNIKSIDADISHLNRDKKMGSKQTIAAIEIGSSRLVDFSSFLDVMKGTPNPIKQSEAIRIYFSRLSSPFTYLNFDKNSNGWISGIKPLKFLPSAPPYSRFFTPKTVQEAIREGNEELQAGFGERPMGAFSLIEDASRDLTMFCGGSSLCMAPKLIAFFDELTAPTEGGKTMLHASMEIDPFSLLNAARKIYDAVCTVATKDRENHPDVYAIAFVSHFMGQIETEFSKVLMNLASSLALGDCSDLDNEKKGILWHVLHSDRSHLREKFCEANNSPLAELAGTSRFSADAILSFSNAPERHKPQYQSAIDQFQEKLKKSGITASEKFSDEADFTPDSPQACALFGGLESFFYGTKNTIKERRKFLENIRNSVKGGGHPLSRDEQVALCLMQQDLCQQEGDGTFQLYASTFPDSSKSGEAVIPETKGYKGICALFQKRSYEIYGHAMASSIFLQSADLTGIPEEWLTRSLQSREMWLKTTDDFPSADGSELSICSIERSLLFQFAESAGKENFYPSLDFAIPPGTNFITSDASGRSGPKKPSSAHRHISFRRTGDASSPSFEWKNGMIFCDGYPVETRPTVVMNDENFIRFFGREQRQMQLAGSRVSFNCKELEATVTVRQDRVPCSLALKFDANKEITINGGKYGNLQQVCGENLKAMPIPPVFKGRNYDVWWTGEAGKYLICQGGTFTPQYLFADRKIIPLECLPELSKTWEIGLGEVLISPPCKGHPLHASMVYWQAFAGEDGGPVVEIDPSNNKISRVLFPGRTYDGSIPLTFSARIGSNAGLRLTGRPEITLAPRDIGQASIDQAGNTRILAHRPPFNADGVLVLRDNRHPCRYELMTKTGKISFYARDSLTVSDTYYSGTQEGWLELACLAFEDGQLEKIPQFLERARAPSGQYPSQKARELLHSLRQAALSMEKSQDSTTSQIGLLVHWHVNFREIADTDGRSLADPNIPNEALIAELNSLSGFVRISGAQKSQNFKMPIQHMKYMLEKIQHQLVIRSRGNNGDWQSINDLTKRDIKSLKGNNSEGAEAERVNNGWIKYLEESCALAQKKQYEIWKAICAPGEAGRNDAINSEIESSTEALAALHATLEKTLNGNFSYALGVRVQDAVNALYLIRFDPADPTKQCLGQFWSAIKGLNWNLDASTIAAILPQLVAYLSLRARLNYAQVAKNYLAAHPRETFVLGKPPRLLSISQPSEDADNPNFKDSALGLVWLLRNAGGDRRLTTMQMKTIAEVASGNRPVEAITWPTGSGKSSDGIPTMLSIMLFQGKLPCVVVPGEQLASMAGDLEEAMRQQHQKVINLPGLLCGGGKNPNWLSTFTQDPDALRLLLESFPKKNARNDAALLLSSEMLIRIFEAFSTGAHRCMSNGGQDSSLNEQKCCILLTKIMQRLTDPDCPKLFDEAADTFRPNQSFIRADSDGEMDPPPQALVGGLSDFYLALLEPKAALDSLKLDSPEMDVGDDLRSELNKARTLCNFKDNGHVGCSEETVRNKIIEPLSQFALLWLLKRHSPPLKLEGGNVCFFQGGNPIKSFRKEAFLNYLRGMSPDDGKETNACAEEDKASHICKFFSDICSLNPGLSDCWEEISMVRGLLHDVLPQSLQKKIYDSYGPSADGNRQVVSYRNGDATTAEPSYQPLKAALFFQTIAKEGLTRTLWKECLTSSIGSSTSDSGESSSSGAQKGGGFEKLFEGVLVDEQQMTLSLALQDQEKCYEAASKFLRTQPSRLFDIAQFIAYKQLTQPLHSFESRIGSFMDLCQGRKILFTATPLAPYVLPPDFSSLVADGGGNAPETDDERIKGMKRTCRFGDKRCTFHRVGSLTLENLLTSAVHAYGTGPSKANTENKLEKLSAIIDLSGDAATAAGGNYKLALLLQKKLLAKGIHRNIIFPRDEDGLWQILNSDGNLLPPFEGSGDALTLKGINSEDGQYVFIYSKSKSVGTNFPWPKDGFAIMTSDPNTDSSATVIQAVGRARNGQPVTVCVRGTENVAEQKAKQVAEQKKKKLDFCKRAVELQKNLDSRGLLQQTFGSIQQLPKMCILRLFLQATQRMSLTGDDVIGRMYASCRSLFLNTEVYFRSGESLVFSSLYGQPFGTEPLVKSVERSLQSLETVMGTLNVESVVAQEDDSFSKNRSDAILKAVRAGTQILGQLDVRKTQSSQTQDNEASVDVEQNQAQDRDNEQDEQKEDEARQLSAIPPGIRRLTEDEQNKEFLEFQAAHSGDGIVVKGQQLCISAYENENVCALSHNLCSACREYVEIFNQFPDIRMSWRLAKQFNHDTIAMSPLRERPRYAIRYDENSNNFHDRRVITIFISEEEASEILNSTTSNPFDESHPIRKIIGGIDGCRSGCTSSIENCPVALFSVATGEIILSTEKVKEVEDNILRLEQEIYDFQYEVNFDTDAEKSEFQTRKRNANEKIKYLREKLSDFLTDTGDMMLLANMLQGNAKGVVNARPCIESFRNLLKKIGGDTDVLLRFFALNARILRTEASTDDTDRQLAKLEDDPILKTGSYLSPENKEKLRKVVSSDVLEQLLDPGALYDESKLMALSKLEDNVLRNLPALLLRKIFSAMMRKGNETDKEKFRHLLTTSEADFHACRKALQKREGAQNLIRNSFDYFKGHKLISTVDNDGSKISRDGFDPYSESLGINPENLFAWFVNIANELTANDKPVSKVEAKTPAPAPESSAEAKTPAPAPEPKTPAPASESSAEASGPPLVDSASASILNFLKDFSGIPEEMVAKLTTFCGCFENKETFTEFLQTFPNIKGEFFDIWEIIQGDKDTKELLLSVACGYVQGNRGPTDDVVMGNIVDRYGKESKGLGVIAAVASILSNEPGCNINENIDALLEGLTDEWSDYVSAEKVAKNVKSFFVGLLASALCRIEAKKVLEDVENSDSRHGKYLDLLTASEFFFSKAIAGCGLMSFCRSQEEFNDDDPLALFTDNGNPFELLFSQNEHLWKAARDMFMEALPGAKLIEHLKESEKYVQLDAPLYRAVFERETRNLNDFQYEAKNSDILNKRINLANTLSECAFANMYYGNLALTQIFSDKRFSLENISRWSGKTDLLRQFVELATVEQLKKAEFTDRQLLNPKVVAFLANGKNGEKLLALLGERKPSSVLELVRGDPKWKEALNLLPDDTMQSIAAHIKGKEPKEAKAAEKLLALLFTQREHINFFRSYFSAAEKGVVTEILKNVKVQFCHGDVITAFADLLMPFVSLGKLAESIMTDPSKKDSLLGNTLLLERITAAFTYIEDVLNKGKSILGENGKCFLDSFVDGDKERDIIGPIRFIRALAITSESFYSLNNPTLHKGYELLERLAANSTYDKALKLDEDESWIKNFFEKIPQDILEKAFSAAGHRHNDNLLNLALSYGNVDYASNTMVKKLALTFLRPEHRRTYISGCLNLANRFDGKLTGNDKFLNIQLKLAGKANIGNIFKVKIEVAIHLLEVIKNGEVVNMLLENLEQSLGGDLSEDYKKIATFIRLIIRQDKSDELAHWFSDLMPGAADETKEYTCNILKRYNFVFGYNFVSPPGSDILKNSTFKLNSAASEEKNYEEFYATISRSNPAVVMADEFRNPCFTDPILVDSFVRQADFDILESITDKQVTSSAVESWGTKDFSAFIQEKAKEDVVISLFDKTTDNNSTYFIGHINAFAKLASDTSLTEDNRAALKQKILTLASKISNDKVSGLCNEAVAILLPKLSCKQLHSLSTKQVDDLQDVSLKQLGAGQFDASEYNNGLPKRFLEKGNVDQIAKLLDATVNAFPSDAIAGIGVDRFKELVGSPRLLVRFLEEKNVPVKVKQAFSAKQLQLVWGELKTDRRKKLFESISYEIFTAWFSALEDASCTNGKDICKIIFDNCIGQGEQLINLRNFFPEEKITKITKDRLLDFLRSSSLCQDDVARWIREIVQTPKEAWDEFLDANNATAKNKKEFYILMGVDSFKNHFSKSLTKGQIKKFWEHKDLGTLIPMVSVDFFKLASNLPDNWTQAAQAMKGIKNEIISALLAQKKAVSLWDAKELAQMVNDSPKLFNDSNVVVGIIKRIDAATLQPGAFADNPAFLKRMDCAQIYDIPSDLFSDTDVGPRIIGNLTAGHFSDNAHCTNGAVKYFLRGGSVDEIAKLTEQQINQFQDGDYSLLDEDSLSRLCEKSPAPQYILSKIFTARENLQEHFPLTILTSLVDDNEDLFSTINQDVFASLMNSQSTTGDAVLQNAFCVQQCQKRFGTICSSGCSENLTAELSQKLLNTFPKDTFGGNWLKDLVVKERSSNPTKVNDSFSDFMFNSYGLEKAEVIAAPMVEQVLQGNANDGPQSANPLTQDVPPTTDSSTTTGNLSSLKTVCVVVGIVAGALALVGAIVAILFFACGLIPMALAGLLVWQIAAMLFAPAVLVGITGGILFAWYSVKKKKLNGEASDD